MPTSTPTPTQVQTVGSRINWRGQEVYVHGCNMAWNHYTTDFGGGTDGIANNQPTIDSWFSQIQAVGMNTVRWFMFPTDDPNGPYQITRDSNNLPNGIADSVWVDLDAALSLANKHDLTLNMVILNQPTNMPSAWRDTANGREALVDALDVMFSKYANHPRIFGFESFAEADNYIYTGTDGSPQINRDNFLSLVTDINARVHVTTPLTLASIGNGGADGSTLSYFVGTGVDFFSCHWYDNLYPDPTSDYNLIGHNYNYYQQKWNLDKPMIVGECYMDVTPAPDGLTAAQKYSGLYDKGFAGAWGWSATPAALDGMRIDWNAAGQFAAGKTDLGPK